MSVKLQQAIFSGENRNLFSDIKGADLNVLLYLAWCANENQNLRCDPAVETIAKAVHLSSRQVIRIIDGLTKRKLITIDRGPGRSNRYIFSFAPSPDNHSTAELVRMGRAYAEQYPGAVKEISTIIQREEYKEIESDRWSKVWQAETDEQRKRDPAANKLFADEFMAYGQMFGIDPRKCRDYCFVYDITNEHPVEYCDHRFHFRLRVDDWYTNENLLLPIGFSEIDTYRHEIDYMKWRYRSLKVNPYQNDGYFDTWSDPQSPQIITDFDKHCFVYPLTNRWISAFEKMSEADKASFPNEPTPYLPMILSYADITKTSRDLAIKWYNLISNRDDLKYYSTPLDFEIRESIPKGE